MEKIIIKNFLIFDDVEMEIKRLNILIGEQASGKSLLAKLVYFFRNSIIDIAKYGASGSDISQLQTELENNFLNIFPKKFWVSDTFNIEYHFDSSLMVKLSQSTGSPFCIEFNEAIKSFYEEIKPIVSEVLEDVFDSLAEKVFGNEKRKITLELFQNNKKPKEFFLKEFLDYFTLENLKNFNEEEVAFIPANRSSLSFLNRNAMALMANNTISIDPFLKEFGIFMQNIKDDFFKHEKFPLDRYFQTIMKGNYQVIDNEDWIVSDKLKIPLIQSSSGQQEAFPLMLFLYSLFFTKKNQDYNNIFIEEPEAHLFPQAQNSIVSALLYILDKTETHLFITTHSPYILSAVNNAILANDMIEKGKLSIEDYVKMSDGAYPISLDDVSAYSMDAGKITNIKDEDYRMIGGELLDEVSNHFGEVMDKLLDLDDGLGGKND